MKKIIAAAVALLIMTALLFSLTSSAAEEEMLKIEVKDGSITVTVEGDFGGTDWIGFYPASQAGSYSGSILWWYLMILVMATPPGDGRAGRQRG